MLDAFGFRTGAARIEVMLTADEPVLIEIAARLGGATSPDLVAAVFPTSQTDLLVESVVPGALAGFPDHAVTPRCSVLNVSLINRSSGTARATTWRERFLALPIVQRLFSAVREGDYLPETTDLTSSPGYAYLIGDEAVVRADLESIRRVEQEEALYAC